MKSSKKISVDRQMNRFRKVLGSELTEWGAKSAVAESAQITNVYLSKILHAQAEPSLRVALRLSRALGVPLEEMLN